MGISLFIGSGLAIIGGIARSRILTIIGALVIIVAIIVFAASLQTILDSTYFSAKPYDSSYSIYFTFSQAFSFGGLGNGTLTQTLGGAFWCGIVGGVIAGIGAVIALFATSSKKEIVITVRRKEPTRHKENKKSKSHK
jgi:hypothetical protein